MKKIYQTIVDKGHGNCMQAVVASLFEEPIEKIPNFIELGHEWFEWMINTFKKYGYDCTPHYRGNIPIDVYLESLKHDDGVRGFFYATVDSQTYPDVGHAVVVDKRLNIVHDPNPNQLAMKLRPEDVKMVYTCKPGWCINYTTMKFEVYDSAND